MYDRGEIMTEEERIEFLNWVCENHGIMTAHRTGLVGYTFYKEDKNVPEIVWIILKRIIHRENLHEYAESYDDRFFKKLHNNRTGVYRDHVTVIYPGYNINPHYDFNQPGLVHTRFNVFFQLPTAKGETYYGGNRVELKERGYVLCRSGIDKHWTEIIEGDRPRIAISYGFQLPIKKLDELYKIPPEKRQFSIYNLQLYLFNTFNYICGLT